MTKDVRALVYAWHFLTGIPLSRAHHAPAPQELASSMAWYSTVGLLLGGLLAVADLVLPLVFDASVVNVLLIILLVLVTRGLHQDGLADTLDGLAGGRTPADRLAIMRDPRVGAIGATGLFLSLLLRYAGLAALPAPLRLPVLICTPAFGRWVMVLLAWKSPYARAGGGLAAPFLDHLSLPHVALSTGIVCAALVVGFGARPALGAALLGLGLMAALWGASRKFFGGVTGDTLGAANEVAEIAFLLCMPLLAWPH
jgi:adenosylcobinamide-GDP ribazoletransferase